MPETELHLESTAHLCASLQVPYGRIRRAVEALDLKPAATINGIAHWSEQQCERIAEHLTRGQARC